MGAVHTLVAKVLGELIHAIEASDNQPLEVELVGDPQVERDVKGIVMGDKRPGSGTSGDRLKDRGLHLEAAVLIEILAHGGDYLGPLLESLLNLRIDDQVDIAHAVAQLRIVETVVDCAVSVGLDYRKHAQALAENGESLGVDGELAGLGDESITGNADYVTYVQQFLENGVVHGFVLVRADLVSLDIDLDAAFGVLKLHERSCTHDAAAHDAACYHNVVEIAFFCVITSFDGSAGSIDRILCGRIRLDAKFPEFQKGVASVLLLLVECYILHIRYIFNKLSVSGKNSPFF